MKKRGVLNSEMAAVVAQMGHGDTICIGDAGLPIPPETKRIDLAVTQGVPSFLTVTATVLQELCVEEVIVAQELTENREFYEKLQQLLPVKKITLVEHEELKRRLSQTKAVIRTGEFTPYANIILKSGVIF